MKAVVYTKTGGLEVVKQQSVQVPIPGDKALVASFASHNFTYYAGAFTNQPDYLQYAKELAETGSLHAYIDRVYSVNETTEAIQYLLSSHASGKVVIKIDF